mmetsp:Transcript_15054/g.24551  ORF Transcript_15054/g.24551 Transcript_15054/m.24551 type:complete len:299 (+) Transcript_15054:23-919(+)
MSFFFWGSSSSANKDGEPSLADMAPYFNFEILTLIHGFYGLSKGEEDGKKLRLFRNDSRETLARKYPSWSLNYLDRYLFARDNNANKASEQFEEYLNFLNKEMKQPGFDKQAMQYIGSGRQTLTWWMGKAKDGTDILGFRMCLLSEEHIKEPEKVALACCWAVEQYVRRIGPYKKPRLTVLAPTNPIDGAPNLPAHRLIGVIRAMSGVLGSRYPELLQSVVIFPMPWIGRALWEIVRVFLDPKTAAKIRFLGGVEKKHAPMPDRIYKYVEKDQCDDTWLMSINETKTKPKNSITLNDK